MDLQQCLLKEKSITRHAIIFTSTISVQAEISVMQTFAVF